MRDAISRSPVFCKCCSLRSRRASRSARCRSLETPGGLERYRIGSPELRRIVPWYAEGIKPLEKFDAPPLVPLPELRTTKPGKFFDSLPSPYTVQAPSV